MRAVSVGASPSRSPQRLRSSPRKPTAVPVGGRCKSPNPAESLLSNIEDSTEWLLTPMRRAVGLPPTPTRQPLPLEPSPGIATDLGTILRRAVMGMGHALTCEMLRKPLPPPAPPERSGGGKYAGMVASMRACCAGDGDILLDRLVVASLPILDCLECLGGWTSLSVREARANIAKLQHSSAFRSQAQSPRGALLSVALDAEASAGMHGTDGKGPLLADPSAAIGLLWLLRFLGMWMVMWQLPMLPLFKEQLMRAYDEHMAPYHGWLLRRSFGVAVAVVPHWGAARDRLQALDPAGEAGLLLAVAAMPPVLGRIEAQLRDRGLLDTACRTI